MTLLKLVADAIEKAQCGGREGPFGLYDYTDYGDPIPHHVRDFRDPASPTYGHCVFRSGDRTEALAVYNQATREHVAQAAIDAIRNSGQVLLPVDKVQAEAMQKIGFAYLKEHAPERLTEEGQAAPMPRGTGVVPDYVADPEVNCEYVEWSRRDELMFLDGTLPHYIIKVSTLIAGPEWFAVRLPVPGDEEFNELEWFETREAAIAAGGRP